MSARKPSRRQQLWWQSPELKEIGRAGLAQAREEHNNAPRCGARTKKTGEPCQARALENGRCRVHGGLTPKGDQWHKPQFTVRSGFYERKLARKLEDLDRRRKKIAARVAAMTPEERERYERWHKARKLTSMAARAVARREAKQNAESRARMARIEQAPRQPPNLAHRRPGPDPGPSKRIQEVEMSRRDPKPAEIAAALRGKMQAEGIEIAYEALKDVARDRKAPAQARATAATSIMRGAGMFDKAATPDERPIEERSAEEIMAHADRELARINAALRADRNGHDDLDDDEDGPSILD